jgi:hypothetical protein
LEPSYKIQQEEVSSLPTIAIYREKQTTMNNTNLEKNKLDPEDGDDIPFILCTQTKNETPQGQEDTTANEKDVVASSNRMTFFLKPRRSCQCSDCHHQKDVEPIADMLCDFTLHNITGKDSADESMDLDCSSWSSPVPTLQSFDMIVTPPVVNLPKRRRLASQEEQQEEGASSFKFKSAGPLFPILGRRADHHLHHQQIPAMIHCPLHRRRR